MHDDFDPRDPPAVPSGHPFEDYRRPPQGIGIVALVQSVLVGWFVILAIGLLVRGGAGIGPALLLIEAGLFAVSAGGLHLRRGWGWWTTCAIYCFLFFNLPVNLALWTLQRMGFHAGLQLMVFAGAVLIVAYLNRAAVLRFIRFGTRDGRPSPATRWTPAVVGLIGALLRLIAELV
ncbi:MAG: hypothetical protein HRF43_14085 [Phycisphaerae bacterium]|jgi:hypothetical protein